MKISFLFFMDKESVNVGLLSVTNSGDFVDLPTNIAKTNNFKRFRSL